MLKLGFPGLQGRKGDKGERGAPLLLVTSCRRHRRAIRSQSYTAFELQNRPSGKPSCPEQGLP